MGLIHHARFTCSCGEPFFYLQDWNHHQEVCELKKEEREAKHNEVRKNMEIALTTDDRRRRDFAIWRLYKYLNCDPKSIASGLGRPEAWVRVIIGSVFRALCLIDKECTLKPFFEERKEPISVENVEIVS